MRTFQNYHKHSMYTNVRISDSAVMPEAYATRAKELGHSILSSCEHGWQGNYFETVEVAKKYGLKPLIGAEAYWVKDRLEKDRNNCHMFIGAKNERGRQALNDVLSEANLTGFYGQPRLDIPLILSLPKDDVIVTTACIAYWRYDDIEQITAELAKHFGKNFFLEVQYHNTPSQRELNQRILRLHNELKIPLIMGCDSHYITLEEIDFYGDNDSITWYSHYSNPNAIVWFYNCTGITIRNLLIEGNTKTRNKNTIADRTDTVFYDSWHDYVQYPYLGNDYYSLICANAFDDSVTDYSNVLVENVVSTGVIAMSVDGSQFTVRDCKFYDSPAWAFIITGRNGKCINCEAVNTGYGQNSAGNAAFMTVSSQNITFENIRALEIKRGPQSFDGAGFDFEANTQNIVLKNSSFKNVEGPAIMIFVGGKNAGFLIENTDIENCCYVPTNEGSINMCAAPEAYINEGVIRNVYIKKCGDTDYYSGYSDNTKPLTEYPGVVFENCIFA